MTEIIIEKPSKILKCEENPTVPDPPVSCSAFADHPPPTRESGQQNETYGPGTVGLGVEEEEGEGNKNNKNKKGEQNKKKKTNGKTSWEAKSIEVYFNGASKRDVTSRLDEVARTFYEYSCQLAKVKSEIETTVAMIPPQRRTGTDG